MTESKESKIKKSKTSHFINDYTSYIQKINQEEIMIMKIIIKKVLLLTHQFHKQKTNQIKTVSC